MPKQHRLDLSRRDFLRTGAALTATGAAALAESETQAKTTTHSGRKRPNILYVFSDQHRAKALGCYGDPNINTPTLDKFATQGIRMDACMSSTPVCSPHRTCLMTGQYSHNHGTMSNGVEFESQLPCLAETFRDAGYRTGYAGKWHIKHVSGDPERERLGFPDEHFHRRGLRRKAKSHHLWAETTDATGKKQEELIYKPTCLADEAISFIQKHGNDQPPWLFVLSWVPPHSPYAAPRGLENHYSNLPLPENVPGGRPSEHARKCLPDYYGMVESLDVEFGRILDALEKAGVADDTIVVYSSDHGDMLGSHGYPKKRWPHDNSARVPFLIRYPGAIDPGKVISAPFNTPDVYPTLAGLAGISVPDGLDGMNYAPFLRGETPAPPRDYAFMQMIYGYVPWPGWRALRTRRYMYARTSDGPWLLFDELKDPQELNNLIDDPDHRDTIREMDQRLEKIMRDSGDSWDITATTGDLKNWRPGGKKTKSNNLGVDWPGRVLP